ncbi:hypothetical protein SAMN05216276_105018 [Streptosporangium subroseum]|uniref:Uncharacterized protein n=1 Tax=Streptosporangium subroseum TaxID=106412 RepID=A0A239N1S7_9ACTN|nr:hypothetical protein SAMN05216276_105018 [Streptosporangium subroseum]
MIYFRGRRLAPQMSESPVATWENVVKIITCMLRDL